MIYLSGRVQQIVYDDPSQAFYILRMVLDDPSSISFEDYTSGYVTIRGSVPGVAIAIGSWFGFEAKWTNHHTYGRQLLILKAPIAKKTWDPDSAEKVLAANGVGERVIHMIRNHFVDDFLLALSDQKQLETVDGVTPFVAAHVFQRWAAVQAYFKSIGFLNDLGLPAGTINQVWNLFGDDAEQVVSTDPWKLIQIDGISFQQADEIAARLNLDMNNPNRLRGAIIHSCKNQRSFGHMYMTTAQLVSEMGRITCDTPNEDIARAISDCSLNGSIIVDHRPKDGVKAIYDPWSWKLESESANALADRTKLASITGLGCSDYTKRLGLVGPTTESVAKEFPNDVGLVVKTAVDEWGGSSKIALSTNQRQGVINALSAPISILTGLPGTGKSTCMIAVVSILKDMGVPYLLCAPTGIAAKNLGAKANAAASTIHRAFAAKGKSDTKRESTYTGITGSSGGIGGSEKNEQWECGPTNPHPAKVVILDEASMADQHLTYRLLTCTSDDCRLVFVGDTDQLPSVGPGNVLRDLINSGNFPVVHLTEIFRQDNTSGIVYAAHAIHRGEVPNTDAVDFRLLQIPDDDSVADAVVKIATKLHASGTNFQVLSPKHASSVGVTTLNSRIREQLNPGGRGSQEINVGDSTIREGDRVMIVKNDYNLCIFNGDIGKVARIDRKAKVVEVKIFGDPAIMVSIPIKSVGNLIRLAYACTIHKYQGIEIDIIVMPIVDSFKHQLQRNLLYTAITRARKRVILVGSVTALETAVCNDRVDYRNTLFGERLKLLNQNSE